MAARSIELAGLDRASFDLVVPEGSRRVELALPGLYNVYNALGAAALAHELGAGLDDIAAGLAATRAAFGRAIARYRPQLVIALGDSFHDTEGPARLGADDRAALLDLQRGRDWIWVAGNHDPDPAKDIGGVFARSVALGPLTFRHEPTCGAADGEIAGHLHPSARVSQRGRAVTRKCFAADDRRMIMPAFGAYTGGLNIRDRAFLKVFGALAFTAHLMGERRLYAFAAARCLG